MPSAENMPPALLSEEDDAEKQLMPQKRMDRSTTIQYIPEDESRDLAGLLGLRTPRVVVGARE